MYNLIKGSCSCGNVVFSSTEAPVIQFFCHCKDCQIATGALYARTVIFNAASVKTKGDVARRVFTAESGATTFRNACKTCGNVMFDISEQYPHLIGVMAEHIDAPFQFSPSHHIWVQSRNENMVLDDGLPQRAKGFFEK